MAVKKIAIIGSFCTGKTTLAEQLKDYTGYEIIPEVARLAFESGMKLDQGATIETELWMLCKQLELETRHEIFIADRSFIDMMAYINILMKNQEGGPMLSRMAGNILDHQLPKYDIIFYTPIEFKIHDDGIRSTDAKFQKDIDREILQLFRIFRVNFTTLSGSPEERLNQAKKAILHTTQ